MTAPTPSAEELDALEALLRPGSQGTCAMCDQVCDTAADAIKALRQQVAELQQMPIMLMQQSTQRLAAIQRLESELTASRERVEILEDLVRGADSACAEDGYYFPDGWDARAAKALAPASDAKEGKS